MNKIYLTLVIGILILSCTEKKTQNEIAEAKTELDQNLANFLSEMVVVDQLAASNAFPPKNYTHLTQGEWESFKDSVFTTHQTRIEKIFNKFGFPGYDLVGEAGSNDFWLLTQHSDHNLKFQQTILDKMRIEVDKGNADSRSYGLLVDRVKLNSGQKQVYGTQLAFNFEICQAYPKNLADSLNVNDRRKSIGLEPIEVYMNDMTEIHFEMNKQFYFDKGVTKPKLYETE